MDAISRKIIINYLEERHLADGGYFFAWVSPSSGLDTYLAVLTLRLLGRKIQHKKSIIAFWNREEKNGNLDDVFSIFLALKTRKALRVSTTRFRKYKPLLVRQYNELILPRGFLATRTKSNEKKKLSTALNALSISGRDLETLWYITALNRDLGLRMMSRKRVISLVLSLQNADGGFGVRGRSQLLTTYHALRILQAIRYKPKLNSSHGYLITQYSTFNYLEELFFVVASLDMLRQPLPNTRRILLFIELCQRSNGGFGRAPVTSISTIENTYQAVSIIKVYERRTHTNNIYD